MCETFLPLFTLEVSHYAIWHMNMKVNATQSHWSGLLVYFFEQKLAKNCATEEDHLNKARIYIYI